MTNCIISQENNIFYATKTIPFPDIQVAFNAQNPDRCNKILCPFHNEKTPSFHVYDDCGHCFGCGWHGDGIDFVAELYSLTLIEAARLIAKKFYLPIGRPLTIKDQQVVNKLQEKRKRSHLYREIEEKTFRNMADFRSLALKILDTTDLNNLSPEAEKAVHLLPQVEFSMQILASGTIEEKLQLLRDGVLLKWARIK